MARAPTNQSAADPSPRRDDALARILLFVRRFGPEYAALGMHAAVPLGLSPELLHLIRYNFVPRAPRIAEADLLLSPLCSEVGAGYYQMDRAVRDVLLSELRGESRFGPRRLGEVSQLLLAFVERERSVGHDPESASFLLALEWTALSYTQPAAAAEALAAALSGELRGGDSTDILRVVNITQSLSDALVGHDEVVLYASGVAQLCAGELVAAARFFQAMGDTAQPTPVGRALLPAADAVMKSVRHDAQAGASTAVSSGATSAHEVVQDTEETELSESVRLDELRRIYEHLRGESEFTALAEGLLSESQRHRVLEEFQLALSLATELELLARARHDDIWVAKSLEQQAALREAMGDVNRALQLLDQEEEIWQRLDEPRMLRECLGRQQILRRQLSKEGAMLRIFLSSTSDVTEERHHARAVIEELQKQYPEVTLAPVLWEDLALTATESFQEKFEFILNNQPIEVAVFIIGSRLGTPIRLPGEEYRSAIEREFDLMLTAFEQSAHKRPIILAYTRSDDAGFRQKLEHAPAAALEEIIAQRKLAEKFIKEKFGDAEGRNVRAYHSYVSPVDFAQRLRVHLRQVLDDLLGGDAARKEMPAEDATPKNVVREERLPAGNREFDADDQGNPVPLSALDVRQKDKATQRSTATLQFSVLGPLGSGKTMWLAAFWDLVRRADLPTSVQIEALPSRGADQLNDLFVGMSLRGIVPYPTRIEAAPDPVTCRVVGRHKWWTMRGPFDVRTDLRDFSGEFTSHEATAQMALQANGFLLFLDPTQQSDGQAAALMSFCRQVRAFRSDHHGRRIRVPVAVCVSKMDLLVQRTEVGDFAGAWREQLEAPRGNDDMLDLSMIDHRSSLLQETLATIWPSWHVVRQLEAVFGNNVRSFPISSAGSIAQSSPEYPVSNAQAFGVAEPYLWLVHSCGYPLLQ